MRCPNCNAKTKVLESRETETRGFRRVRRCPHCGSRFTTHETVTVSGISSIELRELDQLITKAKNKWQNSPPSA
jgi:transcriptional regulator NrdR family protein